jgi:hypothetical protein
MYLEGRKDTVRRDEMGSAIYLSESESRRGQGLRTEKRGGGDGGRQGLERGYKCFAFVATL